MLPNHADKFAGEFCITYVLFAGKSCITHILFAGEFCIAHVIFAGEFCIFLYRPCKSLYNAVQRKARFLKCSNEKYTTTLCGGNPAKINDVWL
jgi:hypothetical protein